MDIYNTPPPKHNSRTPRLTPEMKGLNTGQSVIVDEKTALCIAAHFQYKGQKTTRQKVSENKFQIWVIA